MIEMPEMIEQVKTATGPEAVEYLRGIEAQLEQYLAAIRLTIGLISTPSL